MLAQRQLHTRCRCSGRHLQVVYIYKNKAEFGCWYSFRNVLVSGSRVSMSLEMCNVSALVISYTRSREYEHNVQMVFAITLTTLCNYLRAVRISRCLLQVGLCREKFAFWLCPTRFYLPQNAASASRTPLVVLFCIYENSNQTLSHKYLSITRTHFFSFKKKENTHLTSTQYAAVGLITDADGELRYRKRASFGGRIPSSSASGATTSSSKLNNTRLRFVLRLRGCCC